jgi:hypothetical protein
MNTRGAEFDSDGDENQRSSSMPGSSELVDRIESVLKEQVAAINAKLDELAHAMVSVDTSLGDERGRLGHRRVSRMGPLGRVEQGVMK